MADNDQLLKILLKVEADVEDLKKTKAGLDDLKSGMSDAVGKAAALGSALGVAIPTSFLSGMSMVIDLVKQFEEQEARATEEMEKNRQKILEVQTAALESQEAFQKLASLKTQPLVQQIAALEAEIIRLKTEIAIAFATGATDVDKLTAALQNATNAAAALKAMAAGAVVALKDQEALNFARAYGTQTDINAAKLRLLTDQVIAAHKATGTAISENEARHIAATQIAADEADKLRAEAEREAGARDSITPMLREQQTILQGIRQTQQLISENPFIGADEKARQLLAASKEEMVDIARAIEQTKIALHGSGLDPTQYAQLEQRLQLLLFRFRQLGQQIPTLDFFGSFRKEMQDWANQMGTTGQQVAKGLEASIGASFQSLNQLLLTGKFNAQSLVQGLANIGLQLIENLAIQQIMSLFSKQQTAQAVTQGATIAAANAPGAAASSIAQYGPIVGAAAAIAAIAAIVAAIALAHEGGQITRRRVRRMHGGGLASNEVPIIAEEGEIMIRRDVAQSEGMTDFLLGLNAGTFHRGGGVGRGHRHHYGRAGFFTSPSATFTSEIGDVDIPPSGDDWLPRPGPTLPPHWATMGFDPSSFRSWATLPGAMSVGPFAPGGIFFSPMGAMTTIGSSGYPRAIPVVIGPDYGVISGSRHMGMRKTKHEGGLISRYHSGGEIGGSAGGIHIYAFTDLRQLTKHMASKDGQKIIFDTVKGRRIDLGMR